MRRGVQCAWLATALLWLFVFYARGVATQPGHLSVSDARQLDPLRVPASVRAVVLLFTSVECPVSNRYAPDIKRLEAHFAHAGVRFWLVYPNPSDSPEAIRAHLQAFDYTAPAIRDPDRRLTRQVNATITPEAAVFDANRRLMYRGRIDDRYIAIGIERPAPTHRDLAEAVEAILKGEPVAAPQTQAIGCFIDDFR